MQALQTFASILKINPVNKYIPIFFLCDRFLESVSYRKFSSLLWDFADHLERYPLPCCSYKAVRTAFPSENGQYHGFEDDESNNNNILATKDSNHCNLTTSKLCNESANLPKNKQYSNRNITQAA